MIWYSNNTPLKINSNMHAQVRESVFHKINTYQATRFLYLYLLISNRDH